MKTLSISQGCVVLVDNDDFERVSAHNWNARKIRRADGSVSVYASRKVRNADGGWITQHLHRFVVGAPDDSQVDHVNGNPLDNRRENLRICSIAENQRNQRPKPGGTSEFKGVHWHKASRKWRANIRVNCEQTYLGLFSSEADAARAYDAAATQHFGEFARLNFPGKRHAQ